MAQSGCLLREVGTTNRTRAADYAAAIGDHTALILRVHPSNFRIEGFTERPAARELVALGAQFDIPVVEDLGSGNLLGRVLAEPSSSGEGPTGRVEEPTVQESVEAGFDVVCFSGDKLLGGPQAGIVLGREDLVTTIRRHPLMRAVRVDKMTYAALETTLLEYARGAPARPSRWRPCCRSPVSPSRGGPWRCASAWRAFPAYGPTSCPGSRRSGRQRARIGDTDGASRDRHRRSHAGRDRNSASGRCPHLSSPGSSATASCWIYGPCCRRRTRSSRHLLREAVGAAS